MIPTPELWAMLPGMQLPGPASDQTAELQIVGDTALISIIGPTTKYGAFGTTATLNVQKQIRQSMSSPDVASIMLYIDSPGGAVAGSNDLAADVRHASSIKPVFGYVSDMGASAGYNVASQTGRLFANEGAFIGSIGVMSTLVDVSQLAKNQGVKVHPITTGGMKGLGIPGTPITAEHIAYQQSRIDQILQYFVQNVASGRAFELSHANQLADGRLHIAADAQRLGLIDGVMALDEAISTLQSFTRQLLKG